MNSQRQVSTFAIALLMAGLVIVVGKSVSTSYYTEPEDLPQPIVDNLTIIPAEVEIGETVTISVDVRDIDNQSYIYTVSIRIGNFTHHAGAELGPYETVTVSRTYRTEMIGTRNVTVDGLTGSYKVNPLPPPPPPPPPFPITNETDVVIIVVDPLEELNLKIDRIDAELVGLQDNIGQAFNILDDVIAELLGGGYELDSRVDILSKDVEELRDELASTNRELKMMRNSMNNVTILFGAFSVIALGIVAMTRRP